MKSKLKVVGLTGGIASGKTTVAKFMREAGLPVMDADGFGHMVLEANGEAYQPVIDVFGKEILDERGRIDRQKLGAQVFDNPKMRGKLESITHPAIARLSKRGMEMIEERGEPMAVYEAALLVETGVHESLDALIVVSCSLATQLKRVMGRDFLSKEAAAARIASQYPLEDKLEVADYVIENEKGLDQTKVSTLHVIAQLKTTLLEIQ